jgi:DNA-binding NtrC family response regulator
VRDGATLHLLCARVRPLPIDLGGFDRRPPLGEEERGGELRQDPALAAVRIIAITGYGQEQDRRQAMAAGIDRYLAKPVNDEVLQALIEMAGTD